MKCVTQAVRRGDMVSCALLWVAYVVGAYALAELITGAIHWFEDRYGNPDWLIVGPLVIEPNITHHQHPGLFCRGNYWQRNYTALIPAFGSAILFVWLQWYFIATVAVFCSQANEIHAWAHMRCSSWVKRLQKMGLVQSPHHHAIHHRRPYDKYYCVMTNYMNPVLATIKFWTILEWCLARVGFTPRQERSDA